MSSLKRANKESSNNECDGKRQKQKSEVGHNSPAAAYKVEGKMSHLFAEDNFEKAFIDGFTSRKGIEHGA